jgi:TP901 family phage tail tape measure protein
MAKFSIMASLGLDSSKFQAGAKKGQTSGSKFAGFLKGAFVAGIAIAAAALVAFAAKGIKGFLDMNKKAHEVFTLIPEASDKMKKRLLDGAREISTAYGIPVTDALQGMYNALSAGIPKENVVDFLRVASEAAKGGVASLADAVGAITTVLNGYGMEASKARDVSDVLFTTVVGGVTNFTELGANIGKVTPIAAALGVSFSDVGAMFADMTSKLGDGKTAEAGTQLNAMLSELAKSGSVADKNFKELTGTSFPAFIREGGSVRDALVAMRESADENDASMIDMFGSLEAGKAALILTADGARGLNEALKDQETRMNATRDASNEMKDSFSDKLAVAGEKVNDIFRRLGEVFTRIAGGSGSIVDMAIGYFSNLVGYLEDGAEGAGFLSKAFDILAVVFKFMIKVAATQVNIFRQMLTTIELMITIFMAFGKIIKAVFQPLFTIVEGAGAIMMAFAEAVSAGFSPSAWAKFGKVVDRELDNVLDSFTNWGPNVKKVFNDEIDNIGKGWDKFKSDTANVVKEIGDIWKETGNWEFMNEEAMANKAMKEAVKDAEKLAEANKKTRLEIEKKKKLEEEQKKLLQERIAKMKELKDREDEIRANMERMTVLSARLKVLAKAKAELAKKQAERQKEINALIKQEATLHNDALAIVDKLLSKTNLRNRDERRLLQIKARLAKDAQVANDATEEGIKKLLRHKAALQLIKETETEIRKDMMRKDGLSERMIEFRLKEDKILKQIDKGIAGTNKRLKLAGEHQQKFNNKLPPAKVLVDKVAVGAGKINAEIRKAKDEQVKLTTKTKESVAGFKAMGGEAKEIEEGLRKVGEEMESMKYGVDDLKIDTGDIKELPETMDATKEKFEEINEIASKNDLVRMANHGEIKVTASSPIPVKIDNLKLDTKALGQLAKGSGAMLRAANKSAKHLQNIDKTTKGYFINQ